MNYEKELASAEFPDGDLMFQRGSQSEKAWFKTGYCAAMHQAYQLACKADAEVSRLKETIRRTSGDAASTSLRLKDVSADTVELRSEIRILKRELELHRKIERLREGK